MKIAAKPAVTSSADGISPISSLLRGPSAPSRVVANGASAAAGGGVEGRVDELVVALVVLAAHAADRPALEARERGAGFAEQRDQRLVLDLVAAVELLRDELGVVDDLELARAERLGSSHGEQHRPVLGD